MWVTLVYRSHLHASVEDPRVNEVNMDKVPDNFYMSRWLVTMVLFLYQNVKFLVILDSRIRLEKLIYGLEYSLEWDLCTRIEYSLSRELRDAYSKFLVVS